jgi:hypothetical protein
VFPNLIQEAQLGYDVKIDLPGVPLFFQFKLPEIMVRDTAREISQLALPGLVAPFFRMPLMRRDLSDQHAHLMRLENKFPNAVFYATTMLDTSTAFNAAYGNAEVHTRSALFSPIDIGPLPDDKNHVVSYSATSLVAWRCSEAKDIGYRTFMDLMENLSQRLTERGESTLEKSVADIREGLWPLLPEELHQAESDLRARIVARRSIARATIRRSIARTSPTVDRVRSVSTEILVLKELSRVGLGVDLLIAQPGQDKK